MDIDGHCFFAFQEGLRIQPENEPSRPDPWWLAARLESVMFGDRSADRGAARNAGVRFIPVSDGGLPIALSTL